MQGVAPESIPVLWHRLREKIESRPVGNNMEILVDENLDMSQQYKLADQKANYILGCNERQMASRVGEVIVPLYSALMRSHLQYCIQAWAPSMRNTWSC